MAIDTLRLAQGNNLSDTLSSSIGATDLTIPVNTISIWSSTGGKVIIDRGLSTEEIIYCTGISGSSLVVQSGGRGLENTTAQGHNVGATVESVPTAGDWSDLVTAIKNVLTTSTGTLDTTKVVDLTTSQTLTNKVLTDSTNNIMAKSLKSATTTVDVSAATAPTSGQVLTATDSTHATWQSTSSTDGWTSTTDTFTYASASSFTISGVDRTTTYTKGTRVKFTNNSTTYYGVVVSSSFSTNTTVNLAANNDFSIANSAITNPSYSYAVNPQGYPDWFSYTPTYTGFSSNPTSVIARFKVIGKECFYTISEGGSGTSNSTSKSVSLPIASSSSAAATTLVTTIIDNGTQAYGKHLISASQTATASYPAVATASWTASGSCRLFSDGGLLVYEI